jgi:hypothetical protein
MRTVASPPPSILPVRQASTPLTSPGTLTWSRVLGGFRRLVATDAWEGATCARAEAGPFEELLEREGLTLDYILNTHHRECFPPAASRAHLPRLETMRAV